MVGRVHRADRLAGRVVAVLAEHGHEHHPLHAAFVVVAHDLQPGHLPALDDPQLADDADVVLGIAGRRAGAAADAPIEVHHHGPAVVVVVVGRVEIPLGVVALRQRQGEREIAHGEAGLGRGRAFPEVFQRRGQYERAAVLDAAAVCLGELYRCGRSASMRTSKAVKLGPPQPGSTAAGKTAKGLALSGGT